MPSKIAVHFGSPKTGSTSIQLTLHTRLADERFRYLDFGRSNPNQQIVSAFAADPERYAFIAQQHLTPEQLQALAQRSRRQLRAELELCGDRTALLSSEAIYGLRPDEMTALAKLLRRHSDDVQAVGYLRRPNEFIESSFQQNLKALDLKELDLRRFMPNHRHQVMKLDAAFGQDRVHWWLFDRAAFPAGCVVQDFCTRLGITPPAGPVPRRNDSLSRPAVGLLYAYRKFGPGYGSGPKALAENRALIARLGGLEGPRLRFHAQLLKPAYRRYAESLAWTEQRLGIALADGWQVRGPQTVRSEEDLLSVEPATWDWLRAELGSGTTIPPRAPKDPRLVARWVHVLRRQTAQTLARPRA